MSVWNVLNLNRVTIAITESVIMNILIWLTYYCVCRSIVLRIFKSWKIIENIKVISTRNLKYHTGYKQYMNKSFLFYYLFHICIGLTVTSKQKFFKIFIPKEKRLTSTRSKYRIFIIIEIERQIIYTCEKCQHLDYIKLSNFMYHRSVQKTIRTIICYRFKPFCGKNSYGFNFT